MKKIAITTLGCKVNQYESAAFQTGFEDAGCVMARAKETADIIVINTCAVTAKAGAQSRQAVRQLMRRHPDAKVVITGCYAQMDAQKLITMIGKPVCIVGNGNKDRLVQAALRDTPCDLTMLMGRIARKEEICRLPVRHFGDRTRACLRVQDGCHNFCTYCIVPYTRGPSRSLPLTEALDQAATFASEGHKEIVVTGIHVGQYGKDLQEGCDCVELMRSLCLAHPEIRFRLSSIEPMEISDALLMLMAEQKNFMPHLHIPLQSGDDTILARMNRGYTSKEFRETVELCRQRLPDAAIGIDVLVGFPGESEQHFAATCTLLEELDCTYLHVFPYSQRAGTLAATFDQQIPQAIKDERVSRLRQLDSEKKELFYQNHLGTTRPVLVEHKRDADGRLKGFTDNYIPISFPGPHSLMNTITPVSLEGVSATRVSGRSAEDNHAG
ncbi:MAG: tRNA (N(6)-L-threonylcarbamoyladenosine(37)-C(2))-methylthiotransferase MtaB [Desulfoarculaceae bacterium]|nr:tRNA (N(6)-L-threonylcarbamoyladenosine(37)-C(2))-methylthiotransferase MtaB [Desulfoarculaceae bacterium]